MYIVRSTVQITLKREAECGRQKRQEIKIKKNTERGKDVRKGRGK